MKYSEMKKQQAAVDKFKAMADGEAVEVNVAHPLKDLGSEVSAAPKIETAIADMKRQLRAESKNELIRTWLLLYAQKVFLEIENDKLKSKLSELTQSETHAEQPNQDAEPSGSAQKESNE
jgi:hypothetical protein